MIAKYNDIPFSACQADIRLFGLSQSNASQLGMFQQIAVWCSALVMNLVVLPLCKRAGWRWTVKSRVLCAGCLLSTMGVYLAVLETVRKTTPFVVPCEISNCAYSTKAAGDVYLHS